jgi:hypothetical protein
MAEQINERIKRNFQTLMGQRRQLTAQDITDFMKTQINILKDPRAITIDTRTTEVQGINPHEPGNSTYNVRVSIEIRFGEPPISVTVSNRMIGDRAEVQDSSVSASLGHVTLGDVLESRNAVSINLTSRQQTRFNNLINNYNLNGLIRYENGRLIVTRRPTEAELARISGLIDDLERTGRSEDRPLINSLIDLREKATNLTLRRVSIEGTTYNTYTVDLSQMHSGKSDTEIRANIEQAIFSMVRQLDKPENADGIAININGRTYVIKKDGTELNIFVRTASGTLEHIGEGASRLIAILSPVSLTPVNGVWRFDPQRNNHNVLSQVNDLIGGLRPGERIRINIDGTVYVITRDRRESNLNAGSFIVGENREISIRTEPGDNIVEIAGLRAICADKDKITDLERHARGEFMSTYDPGDTSTWDSFVSAEIVTFASSVEGMANAGMNYHQAANLDDQFNNFYRAERRLDRADVYVSNNQVTVLDGEMSFGDFTAAQLSSLSESSFNEQLSWYENSGYNLSGFSRNMTDRQIMEMVENKYRSGSGTRLRNFRRNQFIAAEYAYFKALRDYLKNHPKRREV